MKRGTSHFVYFLILAVLMIASCQKVDNNKIPPIIFMNGPNPQYQILGRDYCDKGVAYADDKGVVGTDVTISPPYSMDSAREYQIIYTAIDADSNVAYAERILIVKPLTADDYIGNYLVYDTVKPLGTAIQYEATVAVVNNDSTEFEISNFNNYGNAFKVPFSSDSVGNISLYYSSNDTIIDGTGSALCDMTGFRIEYLLQLTNGINDYHKTTFKVNGN